MDTQKIRCKVILGLPLTQRERATFLLFVATLEEAKEFLKNEKNWND